MDRQSRSEWSTKFSEPLKLPLGASAERKVSPIGRAIAGVGIALAVGAAFLPLDAPIRGCIAAALLIAAFVAHRVLARPEVPPRGWVTVDSTGVVRVDSGGLARVVKWGEPFGLTMVADEERSRLLLAFTTPAETRYLGVRLEEGASATDALLGRAAMKDGREVRSSGRLPGSNDTGDDAPLSAEDADRLLRAVAERSRGSLERIYLSDARGTPVVLDGAKLRLGDRTIDLSAALEWKAFMFHESGGRVGAVYQATWVRQADAEAVLVAPMPTAFASPVQSDDPPARELRMAIDGMFMMPLRRALARAPRISRVPASTATARTKEALERT